MYKLAIIDVFDFSVSQLQEIISGQNWFEAKHVARDGESGWSYLKKERPHLAIVDTTLKNIGGLELLQLASQENLPTKFIMTGTDAEFSYAQRAMFFGAIGYCLKPFVKGEIIDCLEKAQNLIEQNVVPTKLMSSYQTGNESVDKMLKYIHDHFHTDFSVQELANICHINYNYAGQLFRHATGETINNYVMSVRMDKAAELLRDTDLSIADVATEAGYNDYFYFAKIFKKYWGTTPSIFRNDHFNILPKNGDYS